MSIRGVLITLVAIATLTLVVIEWPVAQHAAPVVAPSIKPAPASPQPARPPPSQSAASQPVPAQPAPVPVQPAPAATTADVPGDPLAQPENPTEQFMHSRRDDGQHSE